MDKIKCEILNIGGQKAFAQREALLQARKDAARHNIYTAHTGQ